MARGPGPVRPQWTESGSSRPVPPGARCARQWSGQYLHRRSGTGRRRRTPRPRGQRRSRPVSRGVAGVLDHAHEKVQGLFGRTQIRCDATLVADLGRQALGVQRRLEGMEDLGAGAHGLGRGGQADRSEHEFLEVDRVVGVDAAVDHVHHRERQQVCFVSTQGSVERQAGGGGGGLCSGQGDPDGRVGSQPALIGGCRRAR